MCSGTNEVVDAISETSSASLPLSSTAAGSDAAISLSHPWFLAVSEALHAWDKEHGSAPASSMKAPSEALQMLFLPPPDITFVSTAQQLVQAIDDAALDIVIQNHIDLRGTLTDNLGYALPLSMNTRSIRVRIILHLYTSARNTCGTHSTVLWCDCSHPMFTLMRVAGHMR
jgi:hypothetical protein